MKAIENKDMGYVFKTLFISASYYPAKFYLRKSCDFSERFYIYFKLSIDSMHKLECPIQDTLQNPKLHLTPSSPCSQLGPQKTSFFQWGQWAKQGLGFTIPLPCCPDLPAVGTEYDLESMERDYETGISPLDWHCHDGILCSWHMLKASSLSLGHFRGFISCIPAGIPWLQLLWLRQRCVFKMLAGSPAPPASPWFPSGQIPANSCCWSPSGFPRCPFGKDKRWL